MEVRLGLLQNWKGSYRTGNMYLKGSSQRYIGQKSIIEDRKELWRTGKNYGGQERIKEDRKELRRTVKNYGGK